MAARGAGAAGRADAAHRRAHEPRPRTIRKDRPASRRSCRGCSNWAGPTAATCGSTIAGPPAMPTAFADTRRNWSRLRRTSSWPLAARPWRRCCRRPAPCRSCSCDVTDPVGAGFVESLARPGGNATGFMLFEYGMSGKWLELLKEIAPRVTRAAVLRDPTMTCRDRPVRRNPGRGAVARGGVEPGRCARRGRDRARRHRIRARAERRPDRDGERVGDAFIAN